MLWMEAFVTAGGLVEVGHNDRGLLWKWHFAHSQYGVCVKRGTTICESSLRQPVLQLMCCSQSVDKTSTQALVRKAGIAPGIHKGRSAGIGGCHDCERRYGWSFYSRKSAIELRLQVLPPPSRVVWTSPKSMPNPRAGIGWLHPFHCG